MPAARVRSSDDAKIHYFFIKVRTKNSKFFNSSSKGRPGSEKRVRKVQKTEARKVKPGGKNYTIGMKSLLLSILDILKNLLNEIYT